MSLDSGRRDKWIVIEKRDVVKDAYGGEAETWSELCRLWSDVLFGAGGEQRAAAQDGAAQAASFDVLASAASREITVLDHRIGFDNAIWNIPAKQPLGRAGFRLTAIRAAV